MQAPPTSWCHGPLLYPVASGIGTLQAGFSMGWGDVVHGAVLLVIQVAILVLVRRSVRHAPMRESG